MKTLKMMETRDLVGMIKEQKELMASFAVSGCVCGGPGTSLCEFNDTQGLDGKEQGAL